MTTLQENSLFAGRYRIARLIAAGGMGAVYEVVHLETERRRALKVMHPHIVASAELRDRFKREARVAAQIDSEFIVDVFDAGIDDATQMPFLVMEMLKGEELGNLLERVRRFAAPEAITYLWQTALALDKTHKAGIVHRDLKPANLFLTQREDGPPRIKVLDFGVAKFVAETGTQGGATRSLGTPLYMAPEQFRGQAVSPASDNYALAMMAYTLLVGQPYWAIEASSDLDVIAFALKATAGLPEAPSARALRLGVTLSSGFDAWFVKATAIDPAQRFPSATATVSALAENFGLNPARMMGLASSDPVSAIQANRTDPLGSGGTAMLPSSMGVTPPHSAPIAVGGTMGASVVGQTGRPQIPPKGGGAFVAIAGVIGVGVIAVGAVIAFMMLRKPPAQSVAAEGASTTAAVVASTSSASANGSASPAVSGAPATAGSASSSSSPSADASAVPATSAAKTAAVTPFPKRGISPPPDKTAAPSKAPAPTAAAPAAPPAPKPGYSQD